MKLPSGGVSTFRIIVARPFHKDEKDGDMKETMKESKIVKERKQTESTHSITARALSKTRLEGVSHSETKTADDED